MKWYFLVLFLSINSTLKVKAQVLQFTKDTTSNLALTGSSFNSDYSFTNDNSITTTGGLSSLGKFINNGTLNIGGGAKFNSDGFNLGEITCTNNFEAFGYYRNSLFSSSINAFSVYYNGRLLNNGNIISAYLLFTYAFVQNFGTINATANNSTIYHYGQVTNSGTIKSSHNIAISGEFVNNANSKVEAMDLISTSSLVSNVGTFSASEISISSKFMNYDSIIADVVTLTSGGYLGSSGVIIADKIIIESGASFINSGIFNVDSLIAHGTFENSSATATINDLIMYSGTISNNLTIPISGSIVINGIVENNGILEVHGSFNIGEQGSLKNTGTITNYGHFQIMGNLLNESAYINKTSAQLTLLNAAKFDNKSGSIFTIESGASIDQAEYSLLIFRE